MSHSNTTQQTPQWAIDAAEDVRAAVDIMPNDMNDDNEPSVDNLAAIIARHAPDTSPAIAAMESKYRRDTDNALARIAELESENAFYKRENESLRTSLRELSTACGEFLIDDNDDCREAMRVCQSDSVSLLSQ